MNRPPTLAELEAYLDESLSAPEMARIEQSLRADPTLRTQFAAIQSRRDSGQHTVGEIWRRFRLSCPTRDQLGNYLMGAIEPEHASYIEFHIDRIGCRLCAANLADLQNRACETNRTTVTRRQRYFESSAGYLHRDRPTT
jgi:hypothetical protein